MILIPPPGGIGGAGANKTVSFASAPLVTDDSTVPYAVGDHWLDTSVAPVQAYVATDVSVGAAIWQEVTSFDEFNAHLADLANPHSVTAAQTGAAPTVHTHLEADITDLNHTDTDAIHDNVAAEISAIVEKAAPINADNLVLEDSADSDNKKRVEIGKINQSRWRTHLSPASFGANQNDYDPGDANVYRVSATGATRDITGFAPTGGNSLNGNGRTITIWNVGSEDIRLMHQNVSSLAANRILISGGSEITIPSDGFSSLWYDPVATRWRISTSGGDA